MSVDRPDSPETDAELVARALEGEPEAFGALYDRYLNPIYRYVFYRISDRMEAEDLTEETFLKAWEALDHLDPGRANVRAWLYRIAHNTVIDRFRTRQPEVSLERFNSLRDREPSPEEDVQTKFEAARLTRAISQLKPDHQQVIACRFIARLSHAETAEIMELKEGHVRVLQHRALRRLRALLAERE